MESCGIVSIRIANERVFNRSMHTYKITFRETIHLRRVRRKLGHSQRFIFYIFKLYNFRENSSKYIEIFHLSHGKKFNEII